MSRRKIKRSLTGEEKMAKRLKKMLSKPISPRGKMMEQLQHERNELIQERANIVGDMIADGKLDPYKIDNYKYISGMARELGWTTGALVRAIIKAHVAERVRNE